METCGERKGSNDFFFFNSSAIGWRQHWKWLFPIKVVGNLGLPGTGSREMGGNNIFVHSVCLPQMKQILGLTSKMERTMPGSPSVRRVMLAKRGRWRCACPLAQTWSVATPASEGLPPCETPNGVPGTLRPSLKCSLRGPVTCTWLICLCRWMHLSRSVKATPLAQSSTAARRCLSTAALCAITSICSQDTLPRDAILIIPVGWRPRDHRRSGRASYLQDARFLFFPPQGLGPSQACSHAHHLCREVQDCRPVPLWCSPCRASLAGFITGSVGLQQRDPVNDVMNTAL